MYPIFLKSSPYFEIFSHISAVIFMDLKRAPGENLDGATLYQAVFNVSGNRPAKSN